MAADSKALLPQLETIFDEISVYFEGSPISSLFFIFVAATMILNIGRRILIWREKKHGTQYQSCMFLLVDADGQECTLPAYKEYFTGHNNGCNGCPGKTYTMSDLDAEMRILKSTIYKKLLVILANCGKTALPYVSFIYTLVIAIFENKK